MNSDEERQLFEANGWEYDAVGRNWFAPDGHFVSLDLVVHLGESPEGERDLRFLIQRYGRAVSDQGKGVR